ncbi:DUF2849 domain-containing protein [Phyllobacterium salinisoli]|uniref:DUF2849 domain-containing protein n=1 Tax=Phyllobacterium salinisoli TaxID=1899321 RepID=A0A368K8Q8_9HYPH|nr:DUF2849 domain-containing protein [Phyllobacterium salinisoli]RCS24863.1 DUF2849 domain-containing protein [Phyllobacterium salinisoli]
MTIKVLTANRLRDGEVVWYGADGEWRETIEGVLVARDADAAAALESVGKAAIRANLVVDVNLIDVEDRGGELYPLRLRERIRISGPTIDYEPRKTASA